MAKRHHSSKRHLSHHDRMVDRENLMHGHQGKRHLSKHDREVDRENLMHAHHERGRHGYQYGSVSHHSPDKVHKMRDKFNDEMRHDSESYQMGPYPYDRQEQSAYRRGKSMGEGHYAGAEPRRRQEMADAGMIHEDHRAVANLPQEVRYNPYPMNYGYTPEDIDDTMRGVDRQIDYDDDQKMSHFYPKKV